MHQSANLLHATPSDGSPKMRCIYALAHDAPRGRHCPLHQHDHWEFVFYRWGNIECPLGDKLYRTRPGLLLVTPPATPHAEIANTPYGNYHVGIEFSSPTRWIPSVTDDECGSLGHLFQGLVREKRGGSPESARLTELLLEQLDLLVRRAARASCEPPAEAVVRCVERLLEERYAAPLSVQGMAREAGVSSSTLRRNFAAQRGHSPAAALLKVRLQNAVARLENGHETVEAVALSCGFDSASHLTRHFKAHTGTAPGTWRRNLK